MSRKTVFVKVSGDLCDNDSFIELIRELASEHSVTICVGGGTQINDAFKATGFPEGVFGPMGRETSSQDEHTLAQTVLERNQSHLQHMLEENKITASIIIPMLQIGSTFCHINGDQMIKAAYIDYSRLIVVTLKDRVRSKAKLFDGLPKVDIVGL